MSPGWQVANHLLPRSHLGRPTGERPETKSEYPAPLRKTVGEDLRSGVEKVNHLCLRSSQIQRKWKFSYTLRTGGSFTIGSKGPAADSLAYQRLPGVQPFFIITFQRDDSQVLDKDSILGL